MTVREYLERPEELRREIARKRKRIETLRRLSVRLTAQLREITVKSSPDPHRMQSLLAEAADEKEELHLLEEQLRETLTALALYISLLPDERMIRLLEMRYMDSISWEEICRQLGYGRSTVFRLHQNALRLLPPPPETAESLLSDHQ